ncbi:MAG: TonB family protein, partial [bacterium]
REGEEPLVSPPSNEPSSLENLEVIYTPDQVDDPPALITPPETLKDYLEIYYPFEMRNQNITGKVEMELTLDPMGKVIKWEVLNADPKNMGFEEAAGKIVPFLEYSPARKGGKWVAVTVRQRLEFRPPY